MDGAPIDIAMSLGTRSPDVARDMGARLDCEAAKFDRMVISVERKSLIRHLQLYADICRRDADQRLIHDLEDWRTLPEDERRARLEARAVRCEIYAELNRVAAEAGPAAKYDDELDAQLRARDFSEFQRAKIRDLLGKGYAREAYTPGSLPAFVPDENLLGKMVDEVGGASTLHDAMSWAAEVRSDSENRSHFHYRRAVGDPAGFTEEFGLRAPVRRRFGTYTFPPAPYVNADAIARASLPQHHKFAFDLEALRKDDFVVPQIFHESDLPDEEVMEARARRAPPTRAEDSEVSGGTGRPASHSPTQPIASGSTDDMRVDVSTCAPLVPDAGPVKADAVDMIGNETSTGSSRPSVADEVIAALEQFFKDKPLQELRRTNVSASSPAEIATHTGMVMNGQNGDERPSTGTPPCTEPAPTGTSTTRTPLIKFFERFARTKGTWDAKTLSQARQTTELFIRVTKAEDVEAIRPDHILAFREALERLPKSYGKSPEDRLLSIETIIERSANTTIDAGLSAKTINRHFSHFFALLEYAAAGSFVALDIDKLRKAVRARKNGIDDEPRVAFTRKDLDAIFSYATWTTRDCVVSSHDYWIPLLGYYTSARLSEICCLRLMDIDIEAKMIDITPHETRRLKNRSSKRLVPIHPELIRLGFLDFVGSRKYKPEGLIFSELKGARQNDNLGALFSKDWSNLLPNIIPNARDEKKSFHSFRHTVNTLMGERGITEDFRNQILGHTGKTTNGRVYTHAYDKEFIREAIEKIPAVTDHLTPRNWSSWRPSPTKLRRPRMKTTTADGVPRARGTPRRPSATADPSSRGQPKPRRGRPRKIR